LQEWYIGITEGCQLSEEGSIPSFCFFWAIILMVEFLDGIERVKVRLLYGPFLLGAYSNLKLTILKQEQVIRAQLFSSVNSVRDECNSYKVEVEGSNPSPSIWLLTAIKK
jgi:hypothetical protein